MYLNKTRNIQDVNRFNEEAKAHNSKIEIVMKFGDDDLRFTLSSALDPAEETALDSFISNFADSDPELQLPKIYDMVEGNVAHKHFHNINYKTELMSNNTLYKKPTFVQGELQRMEYYKNISVDPQTGTATLSDKVLYVDFVYTRDSIGSAIDRTSTWTWINRDETENSNIKIKAKSYLTDPTAQINEATRRRQNIVNGIQHPTLLLMAETLMPLGHTMESVWFLGMSFLDAMENEFDKFVKNSSTITDPESPDFGKKNVVVAIENATDFWLANQPASLGGLTTIRQYLINEFSI